MRWGGVANDFTMSRISSGVVSGSPFFACQMPMKIQTENSYKKILSIHLPKYIALRRSHLKNKAWGVYNSEIRRMCVFSSHHNWLRRNCSFSLLQKCFSSGLYDICYCRCQNNGTSIFFRILFLFSILNFNNNNNNNLGIEVCVILKAVS